MKPRIQYYYYLMFLILFYFFGCTDLFVNPSSANNNTSDSTTATSKLKITITSPATNDSIGYIGTKINYTLVQDQGIQFLALFVNGQLSNGWIPPNSDGSQPTISLSFDSTTIGSKVSFYLIYYDKDGGSSNSDTISNLLITAIRTPPAVPYNFAYTKLTNNSINLSWKDSSLGDAPGYEIWRKVGFYGTFQGHLTSAPNTFNVNDNNLSDTIIYYYKIRGINKYGASAFSPVLSTYGDGSLRSIPPPMNVVVKATGPTSVQLNWTYSGSGVNYFKIERRYTWSTYTVVANVNGSFTQFADSASGLIPATEYYYRVKAISSSDSSWSPEFYVKTLSN